MTYSFTTKTGDVRNFNNLQDYIQALEAQRHTEALNENRKDFLPEEMKLPPDLTPEAIAEHYYMEG